MHSLTLRRLLPDFAQIVSAPTDVPSEPHRSGTRLAHAPLRRQQEFAAGRRCAAEALRLAGADAWQSEITSGPAGEPIWPDGYVGSITHTDGIASCAVASAVVAEGLGIDMEFVVEASRMTRVSSTVLHACESRLKASGHDATTVFTLTFSAKEAFFKCLYPIVRRRFDYRDAALRRIDVSSHQLEIELLTSLAPRFQRGRRFVGRFDIDAGLVSTGFCIPRGCP